MRAWWIAVGIVAFSTLLGGLIGLFWSLNSGGRTEVHVWCDTKGATINYKVSKDKKFTTVWCLKNGVRVP